MLNKRFYPLTLCSALLGLGSCVAYNSTCEISDKTVIGHFEMDLDISPKFLRTREAPVGNLVADAIYRAAKAQNGVDVDLAVIPAGQFTNYDNCGVRNTIPHGDFTQGDLDHLLGTSDSSLVIMEVQPADFKRLLERSVNALGDEAQEPEATHFLQISEHLKFSIDCEKQANQICNDGTEYAGLRVDYSMVFIGGNGEETSLEKWPPNRKIKIATIATLANGGYNYEFLAQKAKITTKLDSTLKEAVKTYLEEISPVNNSELTTYGDTADATGQRGRIRLNDNCF